MTVQSSEINLSPVYSHEHLLNPEAVDMRLSVPLPVPDTSLRHLIAFVLTNSRILLLKLFIFFFYIIIFFFYLCWLILIYIQTSHKIFYRKKKKKTILSSAFFLHSLVKSLLTGFHIRHSTETPLPTSAYC